MSREVLCQPAEVPASLMAATLGYQWARDTVGESGSAVYRLCGLAGAPDLFLKHGQARFTDDVIDEMVRLRWLSDHLPVPDIRHFVSDPADAWLLTTAIPGRTAYQLLETQPDDRCAIVDALAAFMRQLHSIPANACPFNGNHARKLFKARERIDCGLVEEDDFDDERAGWTAEQVWDAMHRLMPMQFDEVVTHGDFSLDNLLITDGRVSGCIDLGRVGVADRYQDLAILWNCLGEFDASLQDRLIAQYGLEHIDLAKLQFHLMLDEMF